MTWAEFFPDITGVTVNTVVTPPEINYAFIVVFIFAFIWAFVKKVTFFKMPLSRFSSTIVVAFLCAALLQAFYFETLFMNWTMTNHNSLSGLDEVEKVTKLNGAFYKLRNQITTQLPEIKNFSLFGLSDLEGQILEYYFLPLRRELLTNDSKYILAAANTNVYYKPEARQLFLKGQEFNSYNLIYNQAGLLIFKKD